MRTADPSGITRPSYRACAVTNSLFPLLAEALQGHFVQLRLIHARHLLGLAALPIVLGDLVFFQFPVSLADFLLDFGRFFLRLGDGGGQSLTTLDYIVGVSAVKKSRLLGCSRRDALLFLQFDFKRRRLVLEIADQAQ